MKILIIGLLLFISMNYFAYIEKVSEAELLVLQLYKNDFSEYIFLDDNYEIRYNLDELSRCFNDRGYGFEKISGDLSFVVSFDGVFSWQKQYEFYLEKNNEK